MTTMKIFFLSVALIFAMISFSGCGSKKPVKADFTPVPDSLVVPDTGYTGIKKYMSGQYLIKEVTFRNGVREGIMKSFYESGRLRQEFTYKSGLRQDSSVWYYEEGQVFRTTPYINDTINGVQKQYYRNGKLKARLGFSKGYRTTALEEFTPEGKRIGGYPEVVITTKDEYKARGIYQITLQLSVKSPQVRFYRGDLYNGALDTTRVTRIKTINSSCKLELKKQNKPGKGYAGVIAEIMTGFGNNNIVYKKITLPYPDLN
jgi:hypothetical protein